MADLSRHRSNPHKGGFSVFRFLKSTLYTLVGLALIAAVAFYFWSYFHNTSEETIVLDHHYTVAYREIIPEAHYDHPHEKTHLGIPRKITNPTRYLLICRGDTTNKQAVFEVNRRTYEGSSPMTQYTRGETTAWRRFGTIEEARSQFREEFTPPEGPSVLERALDMISNL